MLTPLLQQLVLRPLPEVFGHCSLQSYCILRQNLKKHVNIGPTILDQLVSRESSFGTKSGSFSESEPSS